MPDKTKQREGFPDREIETLPVRKKRQAVEASQAKKDYLHMQEAVRERMAALRAERLAREAGSKTRVVGMDEYNNLPRPKPVEDGGTEDDFAQAALGGPKGSPDLPPAPLTKRRRTASPE
jgi:hypothetical protein